MHQIVYVFDLSSLWFVTFIFQKQRGKAICAVLGKDEAKEKVQQAHTHVQTWLPLSQCLSSKWKCQLQNWPVCQGAQPIQQGKCVQPLLSVRLCVSFPFKRERDTVPHHVFANRWSTDRPKDVSQWYCGVYKVSNIKVLTYLEKKKKTLHACWYSSQRQLSAAIMFEFPEGSEP